MFDLDLRGPTVGRLDDAMRIGRALGVEAVVTVTARVRGDSIRVQAALFDVGSAGFWQRARSVGRPIEAAGTWNNTLTLVEAVARRVLGLQDQPFTSLAAQRMRSRNPDALLQEDEGRSYLERWQLSEAERSFRRAIELDSTFALAHHRLAQTIYWQHAENPFGRPNAFFEVARSSGIALRFSADLPPRDRDHVRAFHGFQEGDYDAARATYRELLATDPTDVYAWLLLGSVEFVDPWLSSAALQASPRGSWNVAVEAFARAVELQPTFELGYGHIFDVYDAVVGTLDEGLCRGFQVPRGVNIPPWERQTPDNQRLFCLVAPDTIAWLPQAELASMDSVALRRGAEGLLAEATRLLVRWSLYAEDLSKPLEELANATLAERGRLRLASPRLLDSLAVRALGFQANALSRKADTLPDDYFRLASLYLASGRQNDALAAAELGLSSHSATSPGVAPPQEAVNALLATGQLSRALYLLASPAFRRFEPDTALGRFVPYGGAETHLQRLSILGGAMVSGPVLRGEIEAITAIWSGPGYSNRDRELLRRSISLDLALALAFDDEALRAWGEASGPPDPLWAALFAVAENRPDANRLVDNALTATTPRLSEATSRFIRAYLAFRVGRADTALRLLASLDSIPLRADGFEARWAIRGSSLLMTADTYSALGDSASASAYYERFVALWVAGDPLTQPLIERAQRALQVQPRASR
jgi:tetratricopeptide (TPR) repeat protein